MRQHNRRWSIAGTGLGLLALWATGCADLTFGFRPLSATPPATGSLPPPAYTASQANKPGTPLSAVGGPPPIPEPVVPAVYEPPSQILATLSQKLAAADDEHKVLAARLHQMEGLLEARDQALGASAHEIEAAQAEIARSRADIEHWKQDVTRQREKVRNMEKENLATLEAIINMLEQVVDTDTGANPPGKPAGSRSSSLGESRERP
jgi:hypothetical protein